MDSHKQKRRDEMREATGAANGELRLERDADGDCFEASDSHVAEYMNRREQRTQRNARLTFIFSVSSVFLLFKNSGHFF
jgi:hypothetical protein